jgi:hypothetical protein
MREARTVPPAFFFGHQLDDQVACFWLTKSAVVRRHRQFGVAELCGLFPLWRNVADNSANADVAL